MIASLFDDLFYHVFLAEIVPADEIDGKTVLRCDALGVGANLFPERLGELRVVENANAFFAQVFFHSLRVADSRNAAGHHNTVEVRDASGNLVRVFFDKCLHNSPTRREVLAA